jgi:hypothetical protein
MNKILLSITTLTLSVFLVTSAFADESHTSGDKGADVLATVAPKSKKMSQGNDKTKKSDKVAASSPHQDGDKGADKVAASSPHQDGDKGADKVAGSTEGHQGGDKGGDTLATVAPKSKKTNNSKAKSKNQSSQ